MFIQLFSNYLVEQSVITIEQRDSFQEEIQKTRVKLGTIAVAEGLLTNEQAEEINHQQTQQDRRFGDIAIEQQVRHLEDIFVACSRYELAFWEMAWNMSN